MRLNRQGGVETTSVDELRRAKKADLVTLPKDIKGTNCFNCKYVKDIKNNVGYCSHPKVAQSVNERMCCALWDARGIYREFGKIDEKYQ